MDLKDFISQTLVQINQGVKEARASLEEDDETVIGGSLRNLPSGVTSEHIVNLDTGSAAHLVHFDVAVTVSNSENASGGGKIAIASVFSLSGSAGGEKINSEVNRMRFTVPISFEKRPPARSGMVPFPRG